MPILPVRATSRKPGRALTLAAATWLAALGACAEPTSAPASPTEDAATLAARNDSLIVAAGASADRAAAASVASAAALGFRFPASLALTPAQVERIRALQEGYRTATAADVAALGRLNEQIRAAIAASRSRDEVNALVTQARDIAARLAQATQRLAEAIDAVLTPAQREWRDRCMRVTPLTADQRARIEELRAAFVSTHKADLEAIERGMAAVRALRAGSNGRPDAETERKIAAILTELRPLVTRVAAARAELERAIAAIMGTTDCR